MVNEKKKIATVVVLGDIGRSPRMSYHVSSLLEHEFYVNIVGYLDSTPINEIINNSEVNIEKLRPVPETSLSPVFTYVWKTFWMFITLSCSLFKCVVLRKSHILICQNPPGVPALLVCYFMCLFGRTRFIIDFHNYTYSILSLKNEPETFFVKMAKFIETSIGRLSDINFCVSNAMKEDLEKRFNIKATVLYDRPFVNFKPTTIQEKHELFLKLGEKYSGLIVDKKTTLFTETVEENIIRLKLDRPALLVSSTSWTPDEDFGILLTALESYPNLVCIITGKGPLKAKYENIIMKKDFQKVQIILPWLEIDDYPKILGSADLGVCLHYSSSGLDLPMKVVDMFGCGLAVCAIDYQCLNELVRDKETGYVFKDEDDLAELLLDHFHNYPKTSEVNQTIEKNLKKFQELNWHKNWNEIAWPLIKT
ncbi:chitobiosyldiphosphodolichol beta-mannosyltransferase isoform X2 [Culicoides brevitarsis]|uniref:chitobiosyldiphosphodolichol beta-mannosyltransferase isoform X2 n=1 Tax=Culicoides brevitarsis TaxID=469753 RepID=UPI00307C2E23